MGAIQAPLLGISPSDRTDQKARGAFFTPAPIAEFLAAWAIADNPRATILDPTCGEAAFLKAAGTTLKQMGADGRDLAEQVFGVDVHPESLDEAARLLNADGLHANLIAQDFFALPSPSQPGASLPLFDAVVGNPPFIRYQEHSGAVRHRAAQAALAQGVRLSGLASSWAALVVHACSFLKPGGRLAMVLPAELLMGSDQPPEVLWQTGSGPCQPVSSLGSCGLWTAAERPSPGWYSGLFCSTHGVSCQEH